MTERALVIYCLQVSLDDQNVLWTLIGQVIMSGYDPLHLQSVTLLLIDSKTFILNKL